MSLKIQEINLMWYSDPKSTECVFKSRDGDILTLNVMKEFDMKEHSPIGCNIMNSSILFFQESTNYQEIRSLWISKKKLRSFIEYLENLEEKIHTAWRNAK